MSITEQPVEPLPSSTVHRCHLWEYRAITVSIGNVNAELQGPFNYFPVILKGKERQWVTTSEHRYEPQLLRFEMIRNTIVLPCYWCKRRRTQKLQRESQRCKSHLDNKYITSSISKGKKGPSTTYMISGSPSETLEPLRKPNCQSITCPLFEARRN